MCCVCMCIYVFFFSGLLFSFWASGWTSARGFWQLRPQWHHFTVSIIPFSLDRRKKIACKAPHQTSGDASMTQIFHCEGMCLLWRPIHHDLSQGDFSFFRILNANDDFGWVWKSKCCLKISNRIHSSTVAWESKWKCVYFFQFCKLLKYFPFIIYHIKFFEAVALLDYRSKYWDVWKSNRKNLYF